MRVEYTTWLARLLGAILISGTLVGAKCIDYDAELAAGGINQGPIGGGDADAPPVCEEPTIPLTAAECLRQACIGKRCYSGRAITFWEDDWDSNDTVRVLTLVESGSALSFAVTDGDGAPADLTLQAGAPVTLRVVAPAGLAAGHDLTGTRLFRSVAWRNAATTSGTYLAPTFDSFLFLPNGLEHQVELRFVPIVAGDYDIYSSAGVLNGDEYAAIAAGTLQPNLTTGDAGAGMLAGVHVESTRDVALFQSYDPERTVGLDSDPRRRPNHAVWNLASVARVDVLAVEEINPTTGADIFRFEWSTHNLQKDVGHEIAVTSSPDNIFPHNFSAPVLLKDSVVRAATDSAVELRAPYFESANIEPGAEISVWFVPTVVKTYRAYCRIGIVYAHDGVPDFSTGHPGAGMLDDVTVVP